MVSHDIPPALRRRTADPEFGLPTPFVCEYDDGRRGLNLLNRKRVMQCALSRVCGVCGESLTRPVAFLGSVVEAGRNAFHFPPMHSACAEAARSLYTDLDAPVLGQTDAATEWVLVHTGGFELERPAHHDGDTRVSFQPNSIIEPNSI